MDNEYSVYILTNKRQSVLYVGVTNDLTRRLSEYRAKAVDGFTSRYGLSRLVHFEQTSDVVAAIERERQIKRWSRRKKEWLIELENPRWNDLSEPLQLEE